MPGVEPVRKRDSSGLREITVRRDSSRPQDTAVLEIRNTGVRDGHEYVCLEADDRRWLINALERWNRDDVIPGGFKLGDIVQHSSGFVAVVSSEHVTSNPDRYVPVKVLADYGNSYKAGDLNGYEPRALTKIGVAE